MRPPGPLVGSIAVSPVAPTPTPTVKDSVPPLHARLPNDEPLRPSIQVSSWRAAITGTPRAWAEARTCVSSKVVAASVCRLAVKAP